MREIKFREWETERKTMVIGEREDYDDSVGFRFAHEEGGERILMQSTGLKDKNGVEIFEGDIVKIGTLEGYPLGAVEWNEDLACYKIENNEKYQFGGEHVTWFHTRDFEVVGNIHQNHELLEVAE